MDRFLKFVLVGGTSFVINSVLLVLGVRYLKLRPSIATIVGAEVSIIFNFIANNFFTFADRSLSSWSVVPGKFIEFNILSCGSLLIQFSTLRIGERIFGLEKFKEPVLQIIPFDRWPVVGPVVQVFLKIKLLHTFLYHKLTVYFVFFMVGVGIGLIVNYLIYSLIIWRQ